MWRVINFNIFVVSGVFIATNIIWITTECLLTWSEIYALFKLWTCLSWPNDWPFKWFLHFKMRDVKNVIFKMVFVIHTATPTNQSSRIQNKLFNHEKLLLYNYLTMITLFITFLQILIQNKTYLLVFVNFLRTLVTRLIHIK